MKITLGTCSLCGGAVTQESATWKGTPPPAQCESCGAVRKQPVIDMETPTRTPPSCPAPVNPWPWYVPPFTPAYAPPSYVWDAVCHSQAVYA